MKKIRINDVLQKEVLIFLMMILFLLAAVITEKKTRNRAYTDADTVYFQEVLGHNEDKLDHLLSDMVSKTGSLPATGLISEFSVRYSELYAKEGMAVFLYRNDTLVFWSDNSIAVPSLYSALPHGKLIKTSNSFFVKREKIHGNMIVVGLLLIRKDYPYENRFIKNGFRNEYNISKEVRLLLIRNDANRQSVFNREGEFLFALDYSMAKKINEQLTIISISLYFLVFVLFLLFLSKCFIRLVNRYGNSFYLLLILILAICFFALHDYRVPDILFNLNLFSPEKFAKSSLLPSMGDLLILSVLVLFAVVFLYFRIEFDHEKLLKSEWLRFFGLLGSGIIILIWSRFAFSLFKSLILDSTISFRIFKVFDISVYTLIGFIILGLNFVSLALMLDKIFSVLKKIHCKKEALIFLIILNIFLFLLLLTPVNEVPFESSLFFLVASFSFFYHRFSGSFRYHLSNYVTYILLFSIFTVIEVVRFSEKKAQADMKIRAVNLSAEHDPVAELLFVDIEKRLGNDRELEELIFSDSLNQNHIYSLLQKKYFTGFWDKYDLQITPCEAADSVYVLPPVDKKFHCYEYFRDNILNDAVQVSNTGFYYIDNMNGRISYFSDRLFKRGEKELTLFIELDTRIISEGLGYPELLLDDRITLSSSSSGYSFAKYNRARLISNSGNFPYYMSSVIYTDGKEGFSFLRRDDFDHLIYNMDRDNTIIVSKPALFWIDILISLSYIFAFNLIGLVVLILLMNKRPLMTGYQWNFKNKIQLAMSSLLLFSLLFIGFGTVYFSIEQYKNKHVGILQEKMQSVYVELLHELEFEEDLHNWRSDRFYNLDGLLEMFSNVIYADINLYDSRGELLATSRPEIFEKGLIAPRMNTNSYREMVLNQRSEFIADENIGGLSYLSSYVPFVNSENKLLAYINLPYFTRQDELTREITNLVVAIVNIFVLLSLLSFAVVVFISNKITQPLQLIQEKFTRINLRGKNERIDYKGRDEIGGLIDAYNEMVVQLSRNVEMIARSERESAWREMAKQIAHEIKNPLTPMRLSIQHLQRTWKDKSKDKDLQLERISKTIIEQIDNLSAIATEFSNFAKMPQPNNEKLNLAEQLRSVIDLFSNSDNARIELDHGGLQEIFVYADKEQLTRVFINLIKNGIQASPEGEISKVEISLSANSEKVFVHVKDNGKGIPVEIRSKLFQPNFTTKSSGMGMGLAIVKSIVKNAGGDVYYETEVNKGTVFTVELPLHKQDDKEF